MNKVLLGADVLLDLFLEREPHHDAALRLLTSLRRGPTRGFTSPVILANVNSILAKARGKTYSLDKLRSLRGMLNIAPIDQGMVDAALNSPHKDFEDSMQMQCALGNGIGTLITRNIEHYSKSRVRVTTPAEYLAALPAGK